MSDEENPVLEAAKMTQRVGEILAEVLGENIPPKYIVELNQIFRRNKEIIDNENV